MFLTLVLFHQYLVLSDFALVDPSHGSCAMFSYGECLSALFGSSEHSLFGCSLGLMICVSSYGEEVASDRRKTTVLVVPFPPKNGSMSVVLDTLISPSTILIGMFDLPFSATGVKFPLEPVALSRVGLGFGYCISYLDVTYSAICFSH
ncbi:hypothetical protein C5167_023010 [Papaver somniferum]|uniref:Uncharacterized protein n=1 Tax=Papaver somniferum TaxID=3469 RepID=A0A4Y7JN90_PAPSO|nr:uncharacterized protein LOC113277597 [Papaver somniferum]RZC61258.1 hypothetical protein C5167_023010 [Papaver somniferum]